MPKSEELSFCQKKNPVLLKRNKKALLPKGETKPVSFQINKLFLEDKGAFLFIGKGKSPLKKKESTNIFSQKEGGSFSLAYGNKPLPSKEFVSF